MNNPQRELLKFATKATTLLVVLSLILLLVAAVVSYTGAFAFLRPLHLCAAAVCLLSVVITLVCVFYGSLLRLLTRGLRVLRNMITPKEITAVLDALEEVETKLTEGSPVWRCRDAFEVLRKEIANTMFANTGVWVNALRVSTMSAADHAYLLVSRGAASHAASGLYHEAGGGLTALGNEFVQLYTQATEELVARGMFSTSEAEEQKADLLRCLAEPLGAEDREKTRDSS